MSQNRWQSSHKLEGIVNTAKAVRHGMHSSVRDPPMYNRVLLSSTTGNHKKVSRNSIDATVPVSS